jgi:hypothetical protein
MCAQNWRVRSAATSEIWVAPGEISEVAGLSDGELVCAELARAQCGDFRNLGCAG